MAREDWESVMVRKSLLEEVEKVAEARHFPNATQYVNEAVRERVERDKETLKEAAD